MRAQRKLISYIGLGSGTAAPLLYSYVSTHPATCVPELPTNFFSDTNVFRKGIDWYESTFLKCGTEYTYGELSLNYLQNAQAASLIARTYPSARLFAVVENPLVSVRVAYVEALRARTISKRVSLGMFLKQNPLVLHNARYGRQLEHYFGYYAPTDLLVLTASEVREDPLAAVRQVFKHIGLDENFVPVVLRPLVSIDEDEIKKRSLVRRLVIFIQKTVKNFYKIILARTKPPEIAVESANTIARSIPLSPELEKFLYDYYRSDVALLSKLMHRNLLVEWGFDPDDE
jgi:hypothetical protein